MDSFGFCSFLSLLLFLCSLLSIWRRAGLPETILIFRNSLFHISSSPPLIQLEKYIPITRPWPNARLYQSSVGEQYFESTYAKNEAFLELWSLRGGTGGVKPHDVFDRVGKAFTLPLLFSSLGEISSSALIMPKMAPLSQPHRLNQDKVSSIVHCSIAKGIKRNRQWY